MHRLRRSLQHLGASFGYGRRERHPRVAARQRRLRRSAAVLGLLGFLLLLAVQVPPPPPEPSADVAIVVANLPPVPVPAPVASPQPPSPPPVDFTVELAPPPPLAPELLSPPVVAEAALVAEEAEAGIEERYREMGVEALDLADGFLSVESSPPAGINAELTREMVEARAAEVDPALPVPLPAPRQPIPATEAPAATTVSAGPASVAIIIDDLGPAHAWSERAMALPGPLTMSFLPYADDLQAQTSNARRHGHEIFLHMPMQPLGEANPGRNALRAGMNAVEIRERLDWAIDRVDGAVGMNNHMGSRVTADLAAMNVVMEVLRQHGLMFVDSKTSPRSVAAGVAAEAGLPHTGRDVFLDHFPGPAFVHRQLAELESRARRTGTAVAIGHPLPTTIEVLRDWIPAAKKRGLRFVTASQVIAARGCDGSSAAGKCGLLQTVSRRAPDGG